MGPSFAVTSSFHKPLEKPRPRLRMLRVSFEIEHQGCWATALSARFPKISIVLRDSVSVGGRARDVICVRAEDADAIGRVADFLAVHPGVHAHELLDAEEGTAFFMVEGKSDNSLIHLVTKHRGFQLDHARAEAGTEYWSVGLATHERAQALIDDIHKLGKVKVVSIRKDHFPDLQLSQAQRRVIRSAIIAGYYHFPRDTSPTKLAGDLKIAKSTLLEHLRKAEAKVIMSQEGWI